MAQNYKIPYIFYTFFWASEIKNHLPSQNLDLSRAAGQWICQALTYVFMRNAYPLLTGAMGIALISECKVHVPSLKSGQVPDFKKNTVSFLHNKLHVLC